MEQQQIINWYCDYVKDLDENNVHKIYHDTQYWFPLYDDDLLFERLILEINQAGLSWNIILKKADAFRDAYDNFNIGKVSNYGEKDIERLLNNPWIIRNKLKIHAAIYNANSILKLKQEYGSFVNWLDHHHPLTLQEWTSLFKKFFKFTWWEIVKEFLRSCGYLPWAHSNDCPIYHKILEQNPAWNSKKPLTKS